jgi:hypothetical protein
MLGLPELMFIANRHSIEARYSATANKINCVRAVLRYVPNPPEKLF